jgi:hypothetical protein
MLQGVLGQQTADSRQQEADSRQERKDLRKERGKETGGWRTGALTGRSWPAERQTECSRQQKAGGG